MVAVYNNERALDIVSLLSACQIVTLDIFLDDSLGKESEEHVFKYTVLSDYSETEQLSIKRKINQGSEYFVKAINEVNEFIRMKSENNIKGFVLVFDIRENKLKVNKIYEKTKTKDVPNNFHGLIEKLEMFIVETGEENKKINAYNKIPNPNGKRPKYEQMTLKEIINILKNTEM